MSLFSGFEHIVCEREPLAPFTWLRLGGAAEYLAEPTAVTELEALAPPGLLPATPIVDVGIALRVSL